jgi:hypothetical protein
MDAGDTMKFAKFMIVKHIYNNIFQDFMDRRQERVVDFLGGTIDTD